MIYVNQHLFVNAVLINADRVKKVCSLFKCSSSDFVFFFALNFSFICLGIDLVHSVQQRVSEIQYAQLESVKYRMSVVTMPKELVLGAKHTAAGGDETKR